MAAMAAIHKRGILESNNQRQRDKGPHPKAGAVEADAANPVGKRARIEYAKNLPGFQESWIEKTGWPAGAVRLAQASPF